MSTKWSIALLKPPVLILIATLILFAWPYAGASPFLIVLLFTVFLWITLSLSWNILSGYSGYFSFGHTGFVGSGAFTTAILAFFFNVNYFVTLPLAGLAAAGMSAGLGLVVFRLRKLGGVFFALTTIALASVSYIVVVNNWGNGIVLHSLAISPPFLNISHIFYTLGLALCVIAVYTSYKIYNSRFGLNLFSIREDEEAAEALGINSFTNKMAIFCLSSFLAGTAGGIFAGWIQYTWPETVFNLQFTLYPILMSILGGMKHWTGPIIGSVILITVFQIIAGGAAIINNILFGATLVLVMVFLPEGIFGRISKAFFQHK